ncbi:hypothetical protein KVR01_009353 [Diaporthe batatas]|uniref:uncharacterized protein n=1 Tax=Diaporthe batatas TaxID=748121 RepID=UPI001D03812B|nr:uncharacterized protein KVR01_009353 [Diaporthe batatas]KAG8161089.1 hypothetical protein KVR01_009353 [Diaporthe batatas]
MTNRIQSPRATLSISAEAAAASAYPPDALPGGRDVETFYGSMRVYEWGPLDGSKVLFVHGDATPCLVFSKIAQGLTDAGYRVMLFGLLRRLPDGYDDQLMHHPELAPSREAIREKIREILGVAPSGPALDITRDERGSVTARKAPSRVETTFDMAALLQWQFDHHQGHVHSFQDTIRHGPIQALGLWRKVCDMIAGRTPLDTPLCNSKLLVFFGEDDGVVVGKETTEDILTLLPSSLLQTEYLIGGHGFPYPNSEKITHAILSFWSPGHS